MGRVHFFPRYSSKENAVTNNTLLLLSRVHSEAPELLEEFLTDLADGVTVQVGPAFGQQVREARSVPDGILEQPSFKVVLETKLGDRASVSQLKRHLEAFEDEDTKVLLILTAGSVSEELQEQVAEAIKDHNRTLRAPVLDAWVTFQDMISALRGLLGDRHYEMADLLEDFEEYCGLAGLLPRSELRMRAVPCGKSFRENMEFGVYYERPGRSATPYEYLGIYKDKAVRGIGRVENRVEAEIEDDRFTVVRSEAPVSAEQEERIRRAVEAAANARGWDLRTGHEFVVMDRAYPMKFQKHTAGGMRGTRYFDLGELLGTDELPSTEEIAESLDGMTWEAVRL